MKNPTILFLLISSLGFSQSPSNFQLHEPLVPPPETRRLALTPNDGIVRVHFEVDYSMYQHLGGLLETYMYIDLALVQLKIPYDSVGITLCKTSVHIWTTPDSLNGNINNFGAYYAATNTNSDVGVLLHYHGGGGIAWIGGLCHSLKTVHVCAIGVYGNLLSYPESSWDTYSTAHELGHLIGALNHTHDCLYNGNNTKIDACGDLAGYGSGTCPDTPVLAPGVKGTIMSYCHLLSNGIKLEFAAEQKMMMKDFVHSQACLTSCNIAPVIFTSTIATYNTISNKIIIRWEATDDCIYYQVQKKGGNRWNNIGKVNCGDKYVIRDKNVNPVNLYRIRMWDGQDFYYSNEFNYNQ